MKKTLMLAAVPAILALGACGETATDELVQSERLGSRDLDVFVPGCSGGRTGDGGRDIL